MMKITILYDNEKAGERGKTGWGFSALIQCPGVNLLFDAGWDGGMLLQNMKAVGFNPRDIDIIVLSHQHWDHIGGVNHILAKSKNVKVYVNRSFSKYLINELKTKAEVFEVSTPRGITKNIHTTGELEGNFEGSAIGEQSLLVNTKKGLIVVAGCSHSGIENIIDTAKRFGHVYGIIGGFHGFNNYAALKDIRLIVPAHCTEHKKEINEKFAGRAKSGGVGWEMEFE